MFTGALAASYYGTPRTTMDADLVVKVTGQNMQSRLVMVLSKAGLQVEERSISAARRSGFRKATFKDDKSPFTVDIILSNKKLKKKAGNMLGLPTFFQTPEELILAKLRMIKVTVPRERASKDRDDVKAILRFTKVDMNAPRKWARKDSTISVLEDVLADSTI